MARIRTIKPEFFKHDALFELERKTGLPIRLAYIGLWCCCDREGRFKWSPRALKLDILPYDDVDFNLILDELVTNSYLIHYEIDGKEYGFVPSFLDHQRIRSDEAKSLLPPHTEGKIIDPKKPHSDELVTNSSQSHVVERKGKEGKGKGEKNAHAQPLPPPPFPINQKHKEIATAKNLDLETELKAYIEKIPHHNQFGFVKWLQCARKEQNHYYPGVKDMPSISADSHELKQIEVRLSALHSEKTHWENLKLPKNFEPLQAEYDTLLAKYKDLKTKNKVSA